MKNKLLQKNSKLSELFRSREASLLLVMILLCALIQWRSNGAFLSNIVITQLTQNYAYTAVLAFGMLLVLLIGGIDISIGAILALSGMTGSLLMRDGFLPNATSVYAVSIAVGLLCGLVIPVLYIIGAKKNMNSACAAPVCEEAPDPAEEIPPVSEPVAEENSSVEDTPTEE